MPAYAEQLLPPSVVSHPLEGEVPTIGAAVGYSRSNTSPILSLLLSRLDDLENMMLTGQEKDWIDGEGRRQA
jgi:LysR family hca operon transcriptional activator